MVHVKHPAKTLAVDFDGVIHAYTKGWNGGACYDDPSPGTLDALRELSKRYRLVVFTARHDLVAVAAWLQTHRMAHYFDDVTNRKPAAVAYIDDRAVRFTDWDQALVDLAEHAAP